MVVGFMGGAKRARNKPSVTNKTTIFGIMGGMAPLTGKPVSWQSNLQHKASNHLEIPLKPAPGLSYMQGNNKMGRYMLSKNPVGSGGVGRSQYTYARCTGACPVPNVPSVAEADDFLGTDGGGEYALLRAVGPGPWTENPDDYIGYGSFTAYIDFCLFYAWTGWAGYEDELPGQPLYCINPKPFGGGKYNCLHSKNYELAPMPESEPEPEPEPEQEPMPEPGPWVFLGQDEWKQDAEMLYNWIYSEGGVVRLPLTCLAALPFGHTDSMYKKIAIRDNHPQVIGPLQQALKQDLVLLVQWIWAGPQLSPPPLCDNSDTHYTYLRSKVADVDDVPITPTDFGTDLGNFGAWGESEGNGNPPGGC